jgi:hypothetical protein
LFLSISPLRRGSEETKLVGMKQILKIQLERNNLVHGVHALLNDEALELPFDQFVERYVAPAFKQLIAEAKARLESPPSSADAPDPKPEREKR